ncbi:DNA topoisomerase IB [Nitrospirillum sp. BR 11164]|uniref:DNA topoisomerase IB n=1 Tax=Nitrospirillum sp. BR 11164 TaxID=3104324 RepID=UPI002B0001C7|nr:DNA topoisomerase IB [Nitrospirillum sp. BR 11164]MEA1649053.1 DNA topoisomerase IB [Nitrospirillum sp. BR 11164]
MSDEAGLVYVSDSDPGIRRRKSGSGFRYCLPDGATVRDPVLRTRIKALVIPPAWTDVWICADANGHLQVTGRDAKGRKQYMYHPAFRQARDGAKFHHLIDFARRLPQIRDRVARDLALPGLPRDKVLATIVHLLGTTLIRVGNADYARDNQSYGLTTLRAAHVSVEKSSLRFDFKGKSGKLWRLKVTDRRVARIVKACQELPGQPLFQYLDGDGHRREVSSADVNAYLREAAEEKGPRREGGITAKDFRTWAGTVMMALALNDSPPPTSPTHGRRMVTAALKQVAARLGNTVTVCRQCYVHPVIMDDYLAGRFRLRLRQDGPAGLSPAEAAVLTVLRRAEKRQDAGNLS